MLSHPIFFNSNLINILMILDNSFTDKITIYSSHNLSVCFQHIQELLKLTGVI